MPEIILNVAELKLSDNSVTYGPVIQTAENEYLFRNTFSSLDLYFTLKKNADGNWEYADEALADIPKNYIEQIGLQIDQKNRALGKEVLK
ncbi:hypothetical protein [Mucilaginibacter pedocola]|uniref:Uncharacterized protein n=1 Tax=Mucilaginibacter pedocola TaxID=1792845 RepID=A0A1S9PED7_9SPHI|nr:hypothetical protein [Mucilaginibacter pedocola]OOQ58978.1 hypothetical protein BC343_30135 [Mucilaginibacter pedocola]